MDFLTAIKDWFVEFGNKFYNTFIVENRWTYLLNGLGTTLLITAFALVIGIILVQLLIIYFVIFGSVNISKVLVAVIAFGLNSAAYVAEIVRSGIMSVDNGQFEAGASLGFGYTKTMISIILPQALRNILPALGNEAIVLLKETSVSGYIALEDLTKGGDIIRSNTYEAFLPLIAVAAVYLIMVIIMSSLVSRLERKLSNDKRK